MLDTTIETDMSYDLGKGRANHYKRPVQKLTSLTLKHYQIIFRQYFFGWLYSVICNSRVSLSYYMHDMICIFDVGYSTSSFNLFLLSVSFSCYIFFLFRFIISGLLSGYIRVLCSAYICVCVCNALIPWDGSNVCKCSVLPRKICTADKRRHKSKARLTARKKTREYNNEIKWPMCFTLSRAFSSRTHISCSLQIHAQPIRSPNKLAYK